MEATEAKTDTEIAIMGMGAEIQVVRIEMVGTEVVGFTMREIAIIMVAEVIYCTAIDATISGM